MARIRIDNSRLRAKLRLLEAQNSGPHGLTHALTKDLVHAFGDTFERVAPRDTNRYVRSGLLAVQDATGEPRNIPAIEVSRNAGYNYGRLRRQYEEVVRSYNRALEVLTFWEDILTNRYERKGRTKDFHYRDARKRKAAAERRLKKLEKMVASAREQLETFTDSSLVIGGKKPAPGREKGKAALATVRHKVYGGRGSIRALGPDRAVAVVHLLEPHASIVESKSRPVARSLASVKARGVQAVKRRASKELRKLWARTPRAA